MQAFHNLQAASSKLSRSSIDCHSLVLQIPTRSVAVKSQSWLQSFDDLQGMHMHEIHGIADQQ